MIQEEKQLLLKDLCVRLPYGVKLKPVGLKNTIISYATLKGISKDDNGDYHFEINDRDIDGNRLSYGSFKLGRSSIIYLPYLRSMSSMTEEEKDECLNEYYKDWKGETIKEGNMHDIGCVTIAFYSHIDWLNAHHFDYRGLIEKGLALEAPEGMYKNKEE